MVGCVKMLWRSQRVQRRGDPREGLTIPLHMKRQLAEWARSLPTAHLTGLMSRIDGELKKSDIPYTNNKCVK